MVEPTMESFRADHNCEPHSTSEKSDYDHQKEIKKKTFGEREGRTLQSVQNSGNSEGIHRPSTVPPPSNDQQVPSASSNATTVKRDVVACENLVDFEVNIHSKRKNRKRTRNPAQWQRNIKKMERVTGKKKEFRFYHCNCHKDCDVNFPEDERRHIFERFYSLGKEGELSQKNFISGLVRISLKKYSKTESCRSFSRTYTLQKQDGTNVNVCRPAFQTTFQISSGWLDRTLTSFKAKEEVASDRRGKGASANKTSEEVKRQVLEHIESFLRYYSNHSRKDNPNRESLHSELNIAKLHRFYLEWCGKKGYTPVKESLYRRIFTTNFNLAFNSPQIKHPGCLTLLKLPGVPTILDAKLKDLIMNAKLKDLRELLKYIPPVYHQFYNSIISVEARQVESDISLSEKEENK